MEGRGWQLDSAETCECRSHVCTRVSKPFDFWGGNWFIVIQKAYSHIDDEVSFAKDNNDFQQVSKGERLVSQKIDEQCWTRLSIIDGLFIGKFCPRDSIDRLICRSLFLVATPLTVALCLGVYRKDKGRWSRSCTASSDLITMRYRVQSF